MSTPASGSSLQTERRCISFPVPDTGTSRVQTTAVKRMSQQSESHEAFGLSLHIKLIFVLFFSPLRAISLRLKKNTLVHIFIKNAFLLKNAHHHQSLQGGGIFLLGEGLAFSLWETPCSATMPADDAAAPGSEHRGLGGACASARLILSISPSGRSEPELSLQMHVSFCGCSEG